jgi:hypothetical protein
MNATSMVLNITRQSCMDYIMIDNKNVCIYGIRGNLIFAWTQINISYLVNDLHDQLSQSELTLL